MEKVTSDILKQLNDENYGEEAIYADSEIELVNNFKKYFEEQGYYDEEEINEKLKAVKIEWDGAGYYIESGLAIGDGLIISLAEAEKNEIDVVTTKTDDGFLILDDCNEDISDTFLDYLNDTFLENNPEFKDLKMFSIKFKIPQEHEEILDELEDRFTKMIDKKVGIYHQCNIWNKYQICSDVYDVLDVDTTYIFTKTEKDIEDAIMDEFYEFLSEYDIKINIIE